MSKLSFASRPMVISGVSRGITVDKPVEMAREQRARALHNFSLPCLKWGSQRHLRCMKVDSFGQGSSTDHRSSPSEAEDASVGQRIKSESEKRKSFNKPESCKKSPSPPSIRPKRIGSEGDDGIELVREKLIQDLQTAADKMDVAIFKEREVRELTEVKPWNLRTRRAASQAPIGRESLKIDERKPSESPQRLESSPAKSMRLRGVTPSPLVEEKERSSLSVSLSRQEIEDDFMAMTGVKPARRPKKRARTVQKHLDPLFPGLWLYDITADRYKVPEIPESAKR